MEDILASIKKVIAEEKELRTAVATDDELGEQVSDSAAEEDVLELDEPLAPADLGPPLLDGGAADETRHSLQELTSVAAAAPAAQQGNPLEEMVREMLRSMLKQWLDEHLPEIVSEHVRREISRITGRQV